MELHSSLQIGMNNPAIYLQNINNCLISGVTIEWERGKSGFNVGNGPEGIKINGGVNDRVDKAFIYNIRCFGFFAESSASINSVNDGITNSKITNCGWNGITR